MAEELGIEELIVNTIVWEQAKRLRSYELLAGEFGLKPYGSESLATHLVS